MGAAISRSVFLENPWGSPDPSPLRSRPDRASGCSVVISIRLARADSASDLVSLLLRKLWSCPSYALAGSARSARCRFAS